MTKPDTRPLIEAALELTLARPKRLTSAQIEAEKKHCKEDKAYFINTYCKIYDNDARAWIPFALWPAQRRVLRVMETTTRAVDLKCRQVGSTWEALAYALHEGIFLSIAEILMFSLREDEALALLSEQRLRGMYDQLPTWMRPAITMDNKAELRFDNGSGFRALPESAGGDSRTVTLVIIDEADLITNLSTLLTRVEPTLGERGQLFLIGRAVLDKPLSPFKNIYLATRDGKMDGKAIFIPWFDHPGRVAFRAVLSEATPTSLLTDKPLWGSYDKLTALIPSTEAAYRLRLYNVTKQSFRAVERVADGVIYTPETADDWSVGDEVLECAFRDKKERDELAKNGNTDGAREQYPYTDIEAMQGRSSNKRIPSLFLEGRYRVTLPLAKPHEAPTLPQLLLYKLPEVGRSYVLGADPAGGNPGSDPSVAEVVDALTLEEVAVFDGKIEPDVFAANLVLIGAYYNRARMLVERNNHGNTVLTKLKEAQYPYVINGLDNKRGWYSTAPANTFKYDRVVENLRDVKPIIHNFETYVQLGNIEASTLKAPEGMLDDHADAYGLAIVGAQLGTSNMEQVPYTGLYGTQVATLPDTPLPRTSIAPKSESISPELAQMLKARFRTK